MEKFDIKFIATGFSNIRIETKYLHIPDTFVIGNTFETAYFTYNYETSFPDKYNFKVIDKKIVYNDDMSEIDHIIVYIQSK